MRRIVSLFLTVCLFISINAFACAHTKTESGGHDEIMSEVLFGTATYKKGLKKDSKEYLALTELENAVALCLDQYQGSYEDELQMLKDQGIHGLPTSVAEIDFTGNQHHRRYTHRGWDFNYIENDIAHWETRKKILLQTVNHVFSFQNPISKLFSRDKGYTEQCNAFAAFLYYIHVLGDYDKSAYGETYPDVIHIAVANPQTDSPDIFWEIEKYLPIIFDKSSRKSFPNSYDGLMQAIKITASEAREFVRNTPDIKSNYNQFKEYAKELLETLESKIPSMLKETEFFKEVFYA